MQMTHLSDGDPGSVLSTMGGTPIKGHVIFRARGIIHANASVVGRICVLNTSALVFAGRRTVYAKVVAQLSLKRMKAGGLTRFVFTSSARRNHLCVREKINKSVPLSTLSGLRV